MKDKQEQRIKILAQKIVNLETLIQLGKNVQENQKKIEDIIQSLSIEDMLLVDSYICENNMLTR